MRDIGSTTSPPERTTRQRSSPTVASARVVNRRSLDRLAPLAYVIVLVGSAFAAYWAMFS